MSSPDVAAVLPNTTIRTNVVTILDQSRVISSISYVTDSLVITTGQPFNLPPKIEETNGVWKITLEAGRRKSSAVANFFDKICGGAAKVHAPKGGGSGTPKELNFSFAVTLHFQSGGSATIYLAQGSYFFTNNWWIGGSPIFSQNQPRLEYTSGNIIGALALPGSHKQFNMKLTVTRPVSPVKHVFVLMMENHSFDNMLALSGIPQIIAATGGNCNSWNGKAYCVQGDAPGTMPTDPGHEFTDVVEQLAGQGASYPPRGPYPPINNSGFAANYATTTSEGTPLPAAEIGDIMKCFDTQSQLPVLYQLASEFVVCDQWFSSLPGPTWPNRFFLHGASSNGLDHSPSAEEMAEWEAIDGFTYPNGSIFDAMNENDIPWRLYHDTNGPIEGSVSQVSSLRNIELWDVHELSTFESDVQSSSYPYQYTFIEPNYGDIINGSYEGGSSQHPMDGVANGEALIAKVYESIRNSPLWMSSMLIITYDEHGGFYDHFAPGAAPAPGDGGEMSKYNKNGFTFAQYGVRVPAVIVSPVLGNYVDHTVYDHASVLSTLEWLFGLPPLTQRDAKANSIKGVVPVAAPRTDYPTKLMAPATQSERPRLTDAESAARELEPMPEGKSLMGFLGVLLKADSKLSAHAEDRQAAIAKFGAIRTRGDARAYLREVMGKVQIERARRAR